MNSGTDSSRATTMSRYLEIKIDEKALGLYPLRDWLAAHHVDVGSIKTARQALFLAQQLGKVRRRMPKRGDEFRALMAVQNTLTGSGRGRPAPTAKTYERGFGTFGPAGEVRRIDPSTYQSGGAT